MKYVANRLSQQPVPAWITPLPTCPVAVSTTIWTVQLMFRLRLPLSFSSGTLATYAARFCNPSAATPACPSTSSVVPACTAPTDFKDVIVVACGWSDDDTAVHRVTQRVQGTPSIPGDMPNPLISRGAAGLATGGASIYNYFNDLTIWSGQALTSVSNNSKTYVRDSANPTYATADTTINSSTNDNPDEPDYRDMSGGSATCTNRPGYTCSTKGGQLGFDTITGDTQLSSYSNDQFFERFLGSSPSDYYANSVSYKVDLNNTLSGENSTSANSLNGLQAETVWVSGDLTLPANAVVGTQANPVILVVDGNFHLSSNFTVNGIVYVRGNVDGNGGPTVYGALITEGSVSINGNPNIVYMPMGDSSGDHDGKPTKIQGSWKDW